MTIFWNWLWQYFYIYLFFLAVQSGAIKLEIFKLIFFCLPFLDVQVLSGNGQIQRTRKIREKRDKNIVQPNWGQIDNFCQLRGPNSSGWEFTKLLKQICKIFHNFKPLLWSTGRYLLIICSLWFIQQLTLTFIDICFK